MRAPFWLPLLALALLGAAPLRPYGVTEERTPCATYEPLRRPWFGDLHVHTALSHDASTQDTRNRPADAYRFARGERLGIQPYGPDGRPGRSLQLERPLDFTAVTDHGELLGEVETCTTPGLPGHDSWVCRIHRRYPRLSFFLINTHASLGRGKRFGFCGEDGAACLAAARAPWREIVEAAEAAYDRSEQCRFTTFVAYEWTGSVVGRNLHRNVVFRNDRHPELPITFYEAPDARQLRAALRDRCLDAGDGCDVLVIPHNANLSAGLMFRDRHPDETPLSADDARGLAELERVVEVMQHKGDGECWFGPGAEDELCAFEQLPFDSFRGKFVSFLSHPPRPVDYARTALGEGLRLGERLGVNPFAFGMIASTDTHLGTPGAVEEEGHPGHGGAGAPAPEGVPVGLPDDAFFNPGGLAVAWAEENSRDALFAAFRRREVYGTSGPRMVVRLFAGWELPEDLCDRPDRVARGYAAGVPMGGTLAAPGDAAAPRLLFSALRDPGTATRPGNRLQRIQVVKGWLEDGEPRERVVDVAGGANGASVDPGSCTPRGPGHDALCAVWRDPDFDPDEPAFYYARVVENPSCRWSTYVCNARGVRCDDPDAVPEALAACCDPAVPRTLQERAWTSPIWYAPAPR